jgi:hypothetical protein
MTKADIYIPKNMYQDDFILDVLDSDILNHFEYQGAHELCNIKTREIYFKVFLKEKTDTPIGLPNDTYVFINYLPSINTQDLSIKGKQVILDLTLKGWCHEHNRKDLLISKYPFFTDDLVFTKQLFKTFKSLVNES